MGAASPGYSPNENEVAYIRKQYEHCGAFLGVCGGFEPALRAGLLEGKTATCPRPMVEMLRHQAAGVKWEEKRWVRDGKMWTSGALLNGLDLMVAFVREVFTGKEGLIEAAIEIGGWPARGQEY